VWAQRGVGQGKGKGKGQGAENRRNAEASREAKRERRDMRQMAGLPPRWMEQLREMSPQEQERFLSNNERFKNLPPERQAQVRGRLQQWNSLTPEQRTALRDRERVWRQMTLEQKQYVREQLLPKWQQLPPDRRRVLLGKLSELRTLSDSDRAARLNDEAFLSGLTSDERTMLRDLSNLRVGPPPEPPPGNE
jgi:hypothetical protein